MTVRAAWPLVLLVGLALTLRLPISSLGAVLPSMEASGFVDTRTASALTTIPVLCFSAGALLAGRLVRTWGARAAAIAALAVMAAAGITRAAASTPWMLVVLTVVVLAAISVGNVLVPVLGKAYLAERAATGTAIASAAIIAGSSLGALVGAGAEHAHGWRLALLVSAVPIGIVAVGWLRAPRVAGSSSKASLSHLGLAQVARAPGAWAMALCFGLTTAQAYAQLGWYPTLLVDAGLSGSEAGSSFALLTACGIPAMLLLPVLGRRHKRLAHGPALPAVFAVCTAAGWTGVLLAPTAAPWLWSVLIGIGSGIFGWTMAMIAVHTRSPAGAAGLSAFTQGIGFLIASLGPLGVGIARSATSDDSAALVLLIVLAAALAPAGALVARPWNLEKQIGADRSPAPVA